MPKADEPRVVVRLSSADHDRIDAAAKTAGVGISTVIRESAVREDRFLAVARELALEAQAKSSGPKRTVAAPPADPVPPAASPTVPGIGEVEPVKDLLDQISSPYTHRCPVHDCPTRSYIPTFICPIHGRRTTAVA